MPPLLFSTGQPFRNVHLLEERRTRMTRLTVNHVLLPGRILDRTCMHDVLAVEGPHQVVMTLPV